MDFTRFHLGVCYLHFRRVILKVNLSMRAKSIDAPIDVTQIEYFVACERTES